MVLKICSTPPSKPSSAAASDDSFSELDAPASKRDQNRLQMREAILNAAQSLTAERGYGNFTASDVARLAGCSRRTFFNYFATLPAAIIEPLNALNAEVQETIAAQPEGTPIFDVIIRTSEVFLKSPDQLKTIARLLSLSDEYPELQRYELQGWHTYRDALHSALADRFPEVPEMTMKALTNAVVSAAQIGCAETTQALQSDPSADLVAVLRETSGTILNLYLTGLGPHMPAGPSTESPSTPDPLATA